MNDDYICDDRPVEESERVSAMTDEEVEKEFSILFGEFSKTE